MKLSFAYTRKHERMEQEARLANSIGFGVVEEVQTTKVRVNKENTIRLSKQKLVYENCSDKLSETNCFCFLACLLKTSIFAVNS